MLPYTVNKFSLFSDWHVLKTDLIMIGQNLLKVRQRMREAALRSRRDPETIKLVVVTKEAGLDEIRQVIKAGETDVGENRVKDAAAKRDLIDSSIINWHMVGHLQSNKARDAVRIFTFIHSVDSLKLAGVINKEAKKIAKVQDILIEVNVSGEQRKFGIKPDMIDSFLSESRSMRNINVRGLMAMAPFTNNPEDSRPVFSGLRRAAESNGLRELSMGMTQDFEVAIEEGATMIRVGSAIIKPDR